LATVRQVEPSIRADGTRIWSLMLLERQLRPDAYGRRRGGYLDRRRTWAATRRTDDLVGRRGTIVPAGERTHLE
jgi:hypothetical protein